MIFKRFSLQRKKDLVFVILVKRKRLKAISSVKTKILFGVGYFILWVDLTNEPQHKTQSFLGKISQSHGINLSRGQ